MREISSKVYYNGYELTEIIQVNVGFTLGLGATRENKLQKVGNADGEIQLIDARYDTNTITVPFTIPTKNINKKRELSSMLNTRKPAKLWFDSEPDKYYMALVDSTTLTEDWKFGSGTLVFTCIDPFAHAKESVSFVAKDDELIIDNNGTMPVPVMFDMVNHGDNGFIGIVNSSNVIQLGVPTEIDGHAYSKSECLFNEGWKNGLGSWKLNQGHTWSTNDGSSKVTQTGTFTTEIEPPGEGGYQYTRVETTSWGNNPVDWSGPSLYRDLPPDSNGVVGADNWKFMCYGRVRAETIKDNGIQEYNLTDKNGEHVCGVRFVKNYYGNKNITVIFYVGEKMIWHSSSDLWLSFTGVIEISKMGNTFSFYVHNLNNGKDARVGYSATVPSVTGITYYNAKWNVAGKSTTAMSMHNMQMKFTKMNVNKWSDDPNTLNEGDIIHIDSTDRGLYPFVNNVQVMGLLDLGSSPIIAPVGQSVIKIAYSDFAKSPDVTGTIRPRYI